MSIGPVTLPTAAVAPVAPIIPATQTAPTSPTGGADFAQALSGGVDQLNAVQGKADDLALQAATGQLQNPHDYLIASTQAALTTELTVAVRNKALEAFNDIMRMPV